MTDAKHLVVVPASLPTVEILPPATLPAVVRAPQRRRRSAGRRVEGNIEERTTWADGSKSYQLTWYLGEKADPKTGKVRRCYGYKTIRAKSKQEAKDELSKIIETIKNKTYVARSDMTVAEACEAWLQSRLDLKKVRANTHDANELHITKYIIPHIGSIEFQKLEKEEVEKFYLDLFREGSTQRKQVSADGKVVSPQGLSPRTIQHIHRTLRQVTKWAKAKKAIMNDPTDGAERPKVKKKRRSDGTPAVKALDEKPLASLLVGFRGHPLEPLVKLAARTGMRRSELLGLRWKDIEFDRSELRVEQGLTEGGGRLNFDEAKTDGSRRTISLGPNALAELEAYYRHQAADALKLGRQLRRDSTELVFPSSILEPNRPCRPRHVTRAFGDHAKRLGFQDVGLHCLRHTHATLLLKKKVPVKAVSERLGHSSITITLELYGWVLAEMQEEAATVMDAILDGARE